MASTDPDKRAKLIDELLERKEFSEIWVNKWAELLQIRSSQPRSATSRCSCTTTGSSSRSRKNMPMDQMVQELLGASGGTFKNPATNFYQTTTETLLLTENVAQVFMGMRIQCAQCHNHPFDRWTQDDYYGFAAFFSQIGRKQGEDYRETIVFNSGGGEVKHPVGGRRDAAEVPRRRRRPTSRARTAASSWPSGSPRRENPWFATSFANRVWAHFFGHRHRRAGRRLPGQQPGLNPELLEALGKRFTESKYDLKAPGPRHLQLADLPADRPRGTRATRATSELRPRQRSAGSRPRTCSTRSAR